MNVVANTKKRKNIVTVIEVSFMRKPIKLSSSIDPVCGMIISKKDERYSNKDYQIEFEGKTYRFCSALCKREFIKNANEYI